MKGLWRKGYFCKSGFGELPEEGSEILLQPLPLRPALQTARIIGRFWLGTEAVGFQLLPTCSGGAECVLLNPDTPACCVPGFQLLNFAKPCIFGRTSVHASFSGQSEGPFRELEDSSFMLEMLKVFVLDNMHLVLLRGVLNTQPFLCRHNVTEERNSRKNWSLKDTIHCICHFPSLIRGIRFLKLI